MRIIAGRWKGRRLTPPKGLAVRPTGDRVREAWMSIIHEQIPEAVVADICSGTGALGLECLSRGAASCDFVEQSPGIARQLEANIASLGGHPGAKVIRSDAVRFVQGLGIGAYDIVLADPPYASGIAQELVDLWIRTPFASVFAVEHSPAVAMPAAGETRRYGSTALTFFRALT